MSASVPFDSSASTSSQSLSLNDDEIAAIYGGNIPSKDVEMSALVRSLFPQEQADAALPAPDESLSRKRQRSQEPEDGAEYHEVLSSVGSKDSYMNSHTYGASRFGGFGEYMSRKRAKLQIQNAEMTNEDESVSKIFSGLQIYINGWTEPSVQNLRQLIMKYGGIYHAYLDKKSLVTHIITCSLTPAKVKEFQHMKVVGPEWLLESVHAGSLLPWQRFAFRPGGRIEESQGKRVAQKTILDTFASQLWGGKKKGEASSSKPPARPGPLEPAEDTVAEIIDTVDENAEDLTGLATPPRTPTKSTGSSPRPLYTTDPVTPKQAARVPEYAAHESNPHAQRAMANPAWRAAHTSIAPDFIEGYYRNSRLHHLSTWKAELKDLVTEAQERAEKGDGAGSARSVEEAGTAVEKIVRENAGGQHGSDGDVSMRGAQLLVKPDRKGKGKEKALEIDEERVIMHCDFDSFFVSAGLVDRPHLRGKPVVVCHSQGAQGGGASTSEIASASYEARKFGIKSGMSLQQARRLCPTVMTIPYEFERYKTLSLQFYTILMTHADDLQAVSVDEALIDVTSSIARINQEIANSQESDLSPTDPAKDFAEAIREQVRKATGCEVSIGIAHNVMLARLASRRAKPAGSHHIFPQDVPAFIAPLDIDDLHGFGHAARQKAKEKLGTTNLGELEKKSKAVLCDALGKGTGEILYNALRGIDDRKLESDKPRKSVSCDVNYGIRFEDNGQAETFIYQLAEEVSRRLDSIDMRGRSLTLKVLVRDPSAPIEAPKFLGHGFCQSFNKQTQLLGPGGRATSDSRLIGDYAWRLLKSFNFDPKELRGIGIQIQKLEKSTSGDQAEQGQSVLPFKPVTIPTKPVIQPERHQPPNSSQDVQIIVKPPTQEDHDSDIEIIENPNKTTTSNNLTVDLPSFSQVDMTVFDALPNDVREELQTEYERRSRSRSITPGMPANPRSRSTSIFQAPRPKFKLPPKDSMKNVKRITQQLAPPSRSSISRSKTKLFSKPSPAVGPSAGAGPSKAAVSESELKKLKIDPEVFTMLPVDVQQEQLSMARQKTKNAWTSIFPPQRKATKPSSKGKGKGKKRRSSSPAVIVPPPPLPQAKYIEPPMLKQQGKTKDERLYFHETGDIQQVIETWVTGFREYPPNQKDVDYFAKFLVHCVDSGRSTDTGLERAIAVVKWWLVLLRRYFSMWEDSPPLESMDLGGQITSEIVGRAWWKAFKEVKEKMDVIARKKFGGRLSLK